jgi:hypothetical protein
LKESNIASEFHDGQIDVIFTEPSREQQMFTARAAFLRSTNILIGRNVSSLDTEVTAILANFSPPLDNGKRTIFDAFHDLHKVCVEAISREALASDLTHRGVPFDQRWRSLKILQHWVQHALQRDDAHDIICPLFVLDDLRKLEAHLIGSSSTSRILTSAYKSIALQLSQAFIMHLPFIGGTQAAQVTGLIDHEEVFDRVARLLATIVFLLVLGIGRAVDRSRSAIMPTRGGPGATFVRSAASSTAHSSAVRAGRSSWWAQA